MSKRYLIRFAVMFIAGALSGLFVADAFGRVSGGSTVDINRVKVASVPKAKLAGAEYEIVQPGPGTAKTQPLGFDQITSQSPGLQVGLTTYDEQSVGRMNRQVDWRGSEMVHFAWTKQLDRALGSSRATGYEAWDPNDAELIFAGVGGGCYIHPPIGYGVNYSGYVSLDVDTEGKANLANHHDVGVGFASTVWYDYDAGACFFAPFRSRIPDSVMQYIQDPDDEWRYLWPSHEYQVWEGDTVTHVFAQQYKEGIEPQIIAYFRRIGSESGDGIASNWDYPPVVIDTVSSVSQTITASRVSGKVALVWLANLPEWPWDLESATRGSQVDNDVYYAISSDMGASWGDYGGIDKHKITESDPSQPGWRAQCDLSCLIDSSDILHVVWNAREYSPLDGGTFPHFYGSRLFHWDDMHQEIRVVRDANWDLPDKDYCHGGPWNQMSLVKPQISYCDNKFYVMFVQFNDIIHGLADDCHEDAWNGRPSGSANGELYISVSDNQGYTWDLARNLTNTYTRYCDTLVYPCESDIWPSISRFGMEVVTGNFTGVPAVDPSGGYSGNKFLDVFYVNDRYPGSVVQDRGIWTANPLMWFRVPCIEPWPTPVLSVTPSEIGFPAWTKPGVQLDTTIRLENIGNSQLNISSINIVVLTGPSCWLEIGNHGPINISESSPNYYDLDVYLNHNGTIASDLEAVEGYLDIESNDESVWNFRYYIRLVVADSVQSPELADIRTDCTRIVFNNAGNIGNAGSKPYGGYNLGFFNDCDTTGNINYEGDDEPHRGTAVTGDDNASVYLYEASPFILRINSAGDTVLSHYMFDADWLSSDGFCPLEGLWSGLVDSTSYPDYQYGFTGRFVTKDSSIALELEYFAPKDHDGCEFIVKKEKIYNYSLSPITDVTVGTILDWDIPSDSGVENGSDYEKTGGVNSRDVMFCYGGEYDADSIMNNDCVLADQRYGGFAFYNGYKIPRISSEDSLENPRGPWWTHLNADWVYPYGGFVSSQLYRKIADMGSSWDAWLSTNPGDPDSLYADLHMVSVYGQFDLGVADTLVFVTILATEYDEGLGGMLATIDQAREWIAGRPQIFSWPGPAVGRCCYGSNPGDPDCADVTLAECTALGGEWDYTKNCSQHPCPTSGRCCYGQPPAWQCADVAASLDCAFLGGQFTPGFNCTDHPCDMADSYWKFDEDAGSSVYDSGIYDNNGTLVSSPVWMDGLFNSALEFDGIDDYVQIPDHSTLRPYRLTLMAWIKPYRYPSAGTYGPVVKRTPAWADDANWQMQVGASGRINFAFYHHGWYDSPLTDQPVDTMRWNHVAITFDNRIVNIYLDGVLDQVFPHTMSQDLDASHSKSPVIIGKGFGDEFEGLIDDVKLYSRALSQAEIQAEYARAGCGDLDGNDVVNILDVTYLINYLYKEGPPPVLERSADANADANINILDVTHIINYLYRNGPSPVCR